jgi:redox-sensitive bicupin YhaK (pirin superfamily)
MTALKRPAQKRFELGAPVARGLVRRTRGVGRGPITRLMSPGDLGALVRPFVFLDRFESDGAAGPGFAPHPQSGIAT